MFTAKQLEDMLRNEFLGKEVGWCASNISSKAYTWIREQVEKDGKYQTRDFNVTNENKSFNKLITYRGHGIGEIMVKRAKGKHHHTYWGNGYNDWTYKDIHVEFYNDDLDARIKEIDDYELEKIKAKENALDRAKEAAELLKTTYNLDNYGVRQLIETMNSNKYSILG